MCFRLRYDRSKKAAKMTIYRVCETHVIPVSDSSAHTLDDSGAGEKIDDEGHVCENRIKSPCLGELRLSTDTDGLR